MKRIILVIVWTCMMPALGWAGNCEDVWRKSLTESSSKRKTYPPNGSAVTSQDLPKTEFIVVNNGRHVANVSFSLTIMLSKLSHKEIVQKNSGKITSEVRGFFRSLTLEEYCKNAIYSQWDYRIPKIINAIIYPVQVVEVNGMHHWEQVEE